MAITKQKKGEIVEKLIGIFTKSPAVAFVQFHKLTVKNAQELRRKLREAGAGYYVAKKTLIRKALEGSAVKGALPPLDGDQSPKHFIEEMLWARPSTQKFECSGVALAYSSGGSDVTAPAREVFSLEKKLEKAIKLIGGIFEGAFIGEKEIRALAAIPSRQTLLAQFTNLINSPIQRLVVGLSEIAKTKL